MLPILKACATFVAARIDMPRTVAVATEMIFFRFIYGYLTLIVMYHKPVLGTV